MTVIDGSWTQLHRVKFFRILRPMSVLNEEFTSVSRGKNLEKQKIQLFGGSLQIRIRTDHCSLMASQLGPEGTCRNPKGFFSHAWPQMHYIQDP